MMVFLKLVFVLLLLIPFSFPTQCLAAASSQLSKARAFFKKLPEFDPTKTPIPQQLRGKELRFFAAGKQQKIAGVLDVDRGGIQLFSVTKGQADEIGDILNEAALSGLLQNKGIGILPKYQQRLAEAWVNAFSASSRKARPRQVLEELAAEGSGSKWLRKNRSFQEQLTLTIASPPDSSVFGNGWRGHVYQIGTDTQNIGFNKYLVGINSDGHLSLYFGNGAHHISDVDQFHKQIQTFLFTPQNTDDLKSLFEDLSSLVDTFIQTHSESKSKLSKLQKSIKKLAENPPPPRKKSSPPPRFNQGSGLSEEVKAALKVLGVSQDASIAEITKAYKRLAKGRHPDKRDGTTEAFQELQNAYELLKAQLE